MSVIRLYLDEDAMDSDLVEALRLRNVDVITPADVGMLSRSDEEQLQWALENNRVIYSFNVRDFYQLHTTWLEQGKLHAGIILGQQSYSIGEQMRRIIRIIIAKSAEDIINQVEFFSVWSE
ncbi:MAG: hypothetical protein F6J92_31020 [Symploca sp. SIO1A3]|nr:hypothetical protein [Symploca sp. SIO1A3]